MGRVWAALAVMIGLGLSMAQARAQEAPQVTHADWVAKPSNDDMAEAYPPLANTFDVAGHVVLACKVAITGRVTDCRVTSETPKGWGFGAAALKVAPLFQMAPSTIGGSATVSDVRIPIRFALPPGRSGDSRTAAVAVGAVALGVLFLLGLAANDWIRGRRAPRLPVGAATRYSLRFAARAWRRIPAPLAGYVLLLIGAGMDAANGQPRVPQAVITLISFVLALMMTGSSLRLGFSEMRPGDPRYRQGPLGLKLSLLELRAFAAGMVQGLVIFTGIAALGVLGLILMLVVRTSVPDEGLQALIASGLMAVAVCTVLYGALRLWTFTAAAVFRGGLPLGETWRATGAAVFSPLAAVMLICLTSILVGLIPLVIAVTVQLTLKIDVSTYAGVAWAVIALGVLQPALVGLQVFGFRTLHQPGEPEA